MRELNFIGCGKSPDFTFDHQVDFETGIKLGTICDTLNNFSSDLIIFSISFLLTINYYFIHLFTPLYITVNNNSLCDMCMRAFYYYYSFFIHDTYLLCRE